MPGLHQGFFVGIGGIDFHPLPEALMAQRLAKHHGQGVGFLARGAASAPDPNGFVRLLAGEKPRDEFVCEDLPGSCITQKTCDIDENGIEELDKLLGMHLKGIEIIAIALDAEGLHALTHAPPQAGALIAAEVAATVVFEIFY